MCSPLSVTYGTIELTAVITMIIKQRSFLFSNCVRSWRKSSTQGHSTGRTSCPMTVQPYSSSFCGSYPPLFSPMITSRHFRRWNVSQKMRFCSSVYQLSFVIEARIFISTCDASFHWQSTELQIIESSFHL